MPYRTQGWKEQSFNDCELVKDSRRSGVPEIQPGEVSRYSTLIDLCAPDNLQFVSIRPQTVLMEGVPFLQSQMKYEDLVNMRSV